jgi:opacity protein-like surface antigen
MMILKYDANSEFLLGTHMKKIAAFLVTLGMMFVANGQAIDKQSSWYTEGAIDLLKWGAYGGEADQSKLSPKAVRMVIGKRIMPSISVEGTAGFGMGSGSTSIKEVKVKSILGLYGKYSYELMPKLDVYGKVGFAMVTSENTFNSTATASARSTGLSFGFGATYDITDKFYAGADYTFLPKAPDISNMSNPGGVSAITFFGGMRY